jgi:hypothetical protein
MSYLVLPSSRRNRQPQKSSRLISKFDGGDGGGAWNPATGWYLPNVGNVYQDQTNPGYTGNRFVPYDDMMTLRSYADNGGNSDDRFYWPIDIKNAKAGAFTTVFVCVVNNAGLTANTISTRAGHTIAAYDNEQISIGYAGYNGFDYYYLGSLPTGSIFGKLLKIVISSKPGYEISLAINGIKYTPNFGIQSYIGQGTLGTPSRPTIGALEFPNYYYFNGYIGLWANLPNVFVNQDEATFISENPWSIFEPDPKRTYFDLAKAQEIRNKNDEIANPKKQNVIFNGGSTISVQPIIPELNRNHPLYKDLILAFPSNRTVFNELVTGKNYSWRTNTVESSTPVKVKSSKNGSVIMSTHDYGRFNDGEYNPLNANDDVTILVWAKDTVGGIIDQLSRCFFCRGKDGYGNGWSIQFATTGDSAKYPVFGIVWTSPSLVGRAVTSTGSWDGCWAIGRYKQGSQISLFMEGRAPVHDTSSIGSSLRTSSIGFGHFAPTNRGGTWDDYETHHWYGEVGDIFVWKRALTDNECFGLLDKPFQLYKKPKNVIYMNLYKPLGTSSPTFLI